MIPYKLGNHDFNIPTSYDELSLKQFYDLKTVDSNDNVSFLSIISGLDKSIWSQCTDLDIVSKIYPYLEWMKEEFNVELYTPDFLHIDGVKYKRPGGLGIMCLGQIEHLKLLIKEIGDKPGSHDYDLFPDLLAIIFQPDVDNAEYNYDRAMELKESIYKCSLREAWPLASFFLANLSSYATRRKGGFLTALQKKKRPPASIDSTNSDHGQQFSIWRRPLIALQKRSFFWLTMMYSRRYTSGRKKDAIKKHTTK